MTAKEFRHAPKDKSILYILTVLCAVGTMLLLIYIMKYSAYGFDFTDEGYYLVWMANPFIYDASISQFGFVYHPLYKILNGDIAALRKINILVTFTLAWCFVHTFLSSLVSNLKESRIVLPVISAALSTSVLIFFDYWIPTPSYNSLNLQALLVTSTGLVIAEKTNDRKSILGWILIAIGGWLTFMAKPSTALALAVAVHIYLLISRKFSIRLVTLAAVNSFLLLLISALVIDGSILNFIKRIQLGLYHASLMGGGYTLGQILRLDNIHPNAALATAILYFSGTLVLALLALNSRSNRKLFIGLSISGALFTFTVVLISGKILWVGKFGSQQGLLVFSVLIALAVCTVPLGWRVVAKNVSRGQWAIAALFLAMPHIYAFGTNGNYWQTGGSVGIFWILTGFIFLGPLIQARASWLLALPIGFCTQAITVALLQTGFEQPYRQPQPLRLNTSPQEIGTSNALLILSEGFSKYISTAKSISTNAGFTWNTPLIDLTGRSPGLLLALGAKSIGQAWMIGAYPGSSNLAEATLSLASCDEISQAWVLLEKNGPRSISADLMLNIGVDFYNNYKKAGEWASAEGAGGFIDVYIQELYRPTEENKSLMSCLQVRKESSR